MDWLKRYNTEAAVGLDEIPVATYAEFYEDVCGMLADSNCHIAHYFAMPEEEGSLRFICILLRDSAHEILLASFRYGYYCEEELPSIAACHPQAHPFEREITELYNVRFEGSPWDKPLRFAAERYSRSSTIDTYPFYKIEGESLHEVNVGPIHAGIIEPGAFRFICNGERVLHLEIALGYQHRGVERQFVSTENRLRQMLLAETVAGDSAVSHGTAFAMNCEKLSGRQPGEALTAERAVGLELERLAMHIADTGALCMDIGYQLGQAACEALRTMTINTTQLWCGNRFGKGLVRPGGSHYPLTGELAATIRRNVAEIARRYDEVRRNLKETTSLLARFEQCGEVDSAQMAAIGGVGIAARASGLPRDIRASHPWGIYTQRPHECITKRYGDVMARLTVRCNEALNAAETIGSLLEGYAPRGVAKPDMEAPLRPKSLSVSLVEGWRGEICHCVVTDAEGRIACCKIKDPSLHNWLALALAVRGEGISDFPINNKSFNLSYCGHDL